MLFSGSAFSELPISSTFSMVRTRNNKDIAVLLEIAQKLDVALNTIKFDERQQVSIDLLVNTLNEIDLTVIKFEEEKQTLEVDLYLNMGAVNVVPNS